MYLVFINDEGQHSLWPVFADVPDGWEMIFGEAGRQDCLDFIEKNGTDMRPKSLIKAMEADAAAAERHRGWAERRDQEAERISCAKKRGGCSEVAGSAAVAL